MYVEETSQNQFQCIKTENPCTEKIRRKYLKSKNLIHTLRITQHVNFQKQCFYFYFAVHVFETAQYNREQSYNSDELQVCVN